MSPNLRKRMQGQKQLKKTPSGNDAVSDFDLHDTTITPTPIETDEWGDEGTPITSLETLFNKMGRVSKIVEKLVPAIRSVADRVDQVSQKQEEMGETVKELTKQQRADQATGVKVELLCKEVEKKDKNRLAVKLATGTALVVVLLSCLGSVGGAIWYARGLQGSLELEVQARQDRDKVIDSAIKNLPTRDQLSKHLPTKADVQKLTKTINNDEQYEVKLLRDMFLGLDWRTRSRWCRTKRRELPQDLLEECP